GGDAPQDLRRGPGGARRGARRLLGVLVRTAVRLRARLGGGRVCRARAAGLRALGAHKRAHRHGHLGRLAFAGGRGPGTDLGRPGGGAHGVRRGPARLASGGVRREPERDHRAPGGRGFLVGFGAVAPVRRRRRGGALLRHARGGGDPGRRQRGDRWRPVEGQVRPIAPRNVGRELAAVPDLRRRQRAYGGPRGAGLLGVRAGGGAGGGGRDDGQPGARVPLPRARREDAGGAGAKPVPAGSPPDVPHGLRRQDDSGAGAQRRLHPPPRGGGRRLRRGPGPRDEARRGTGGAPADGGAPAQRRPVRAAGRVASDDGQDQLRGPAPDRRAPHARRGDAVRRPGLRGRGLVGALAPRAPRRTRLPGQAARRVDTRGGDDPRGWPGLRRHGPGPAPPIRDRVRESPGPARFGHRHRVRRDGRESLPAHPGHGIGRVPHGGRPQVRPLRSAWGAQPTRRLPGPRGRRWGLRGEV
ncbi:MAG: hypothetical protein AVDCRST_MAG02-2581, partial [uncultured Rubrobacteraceae bacterium]